MCPLFKLFINNDTQMYMINQKNEQENEILGKISLVEAVSGTREANRRLEELSDSIRNNYQPEDGQIQIPGKLFYKLLTAIHEAIIANEICAESVGVLDEVGEDEVVSALSRNTIPLEDFRSAIKVQDYYIAKCRELEAENVRLKKTLQDVTWSWRQSSDQDSNLITSLFDKFINNDR